MLANIYCLKWLEGFKTEGKIPILVPLPPKIRRFNTENCDILIGPCLCGAWHDEEEILYDDRLQYIDDSGNVGK